MATTLDEIRRAWRSALQRPGFVVLATMTLALGIAASVTVVSLVDRVLLRRLPFPQPGELVGLGREQAGGRVTITPREYRALESGGTAASVGIASMETVPVNIAEAGDPELVQAVTADAGFLHTLSPAMPLGRNFAMEEGVPNGARAVIISHEFWMRRFNGDRDVVGRTLAVEGIATPIVGVLPPDFRYVGPFDLLLPLALPADSRDDGRSFIAVARLAPGQTAVSLSPFVNERIHGLYAGTQSARFYVASRFSAQPLSMALSAQSRPVRAFTQLPDNIIGLLRDFMPLRFAVRVPGDLAAAAVRVREALAEIAPGKAVANIKTFDALVRESTDSTRLTLLLIGVFASLALLLSAVGVYAVVAVATATRQREFGVRAALGDGLRQAMLGLAAGIGVAFALSHVLRGYVAGVGPGDPLALAVVVAVLIATARVACFLPACRSARISPMRVLRDE